MWGAIAGSLLGGLFSAGSARSAARSQERSAEAQLALQREMYDQQRADLAGYRGAGNNALAAYLYEMGMGSRPTGYEGYEQSPGYAMQLREGLGAINNNASAAGMSLSGATQKALMGYGQGLAQQDHGNYLDRLFGVANMGQNSAAMTAQAAGNFGNAGANALGAMGNAQSAGAIGVGNAVSGAINNGVGIWSYQNAMNKMYPGS